MIHRLFFALITTAHLSAADGPAPSDPAQTATAFYTELISRKVSGLPLGDDWKALQPLVTKQLAEAIRSAQKEQAEFMKNEPNEKPPWIEGDLFSSNFEGVQKFTAGKPMIAGGTATVPMAFTYTYNGDTTEWTDTLVLQKTGEIWLVDDVFYGGDWDFGNKGTLQDGLAPLPKHASPDGRFEFKPYSQEENNAGKPPFGIVEKGTNKLLWTAPNNFGDASRPEEWVLWSPDSKSFALVTRVSTRRLGTFFFGWDGHGFTEMPWKAGELETLADEQVRVEARKEGFTKRAKYGQIIADDTLPVRWADSQSIIITRTMEQSVNEDGKEGAAIAATARVLLRWNAKSKAFSITTVTR